MASAITSSLLGHPVAIQLAGDLDWYFQADGESLMSESPSTSVKPPSAYKVPTVEPLERH